MRFSITPHLPIGKKLIVYMTSHLTNSSPVATWSSTNTYSHFPQFLSTPKQHSLTAQFCHATHMTHFLLMPLSSSPSSPRKQINPPQKQFPSPQIPITTLPIHIPPPTSTLLSTSSLSLSLIHQQPLLL
ncbi:unnamed protein product [Prunus brigantina]